MRRPRAHMLNAKRLLLAVGLIAVTGFGFAALVTTSTTTSSVQLQLEQRIRARKSAANVGDSSAWLAAADLHPNATCVDATGAKRHCRPDAANPSAWQQHSTLDSFEVSVAGDVAIATYRETDTVVVAGNTASGQARYIETYLRNNGRWQLLAFGEASIPAPRNAIRLPASALVPLVGSYGNNTYALDVTLRHDTLYVAGPSEPPATLLPLSPTQFFSAGDIGTYEFVVTASQADELRYHHQGKTYRFTRRLVRAK